MRFPSSQPWLSQLQRQALPWLASVGRQYRRTPAIARLLPVLGASVVLTCGSLWLSQAPEAPVAVAAVRAPQPEVEVEPALPTTAPLPSVATSPRPHSPAERSYAEFAEAFDERVENAGSISIGLANRGYLYNGVKLPPGPLWEIVEPNYSWGTRETVIAITRAIKEVNRVFPDTPRLHVGHLSRKHGGWLRPHRSHQSGRDVDLGFYYSTGAHWYKTATPENLDAPRTWALLSAMGKVSALEYVFIDRALHPLLREEAERVGEEPAWVAEVFDGDPPKKDPVLRHARGHDDHMHVRFLSANAIRNNQLAVGKLGKRSRRRAVMIQLLKSKARKQEQDRKRAARAEVQATKRR